MLRNPEHNDADAVELAIELQVGVERQVRHTYVVLINACEPAGEFFGHSVLRPAQNGDYALALRGLEAFIEHFYNHDPLMREQQSDIRTVLHPALSLLVQIVYLGMDTAQ